MELVISTEDTPEMPKSDIEPRLVEILPDEKLYECFRELHSKGNIFLAHDRRGTFLLVGQRLVNIARAIEDLTKEPCKLTSLYDSSTNRLRKGYHYSFRVEKSTLADVPRLVEEKRKLFERVIVAANNPLAWKVSTPLSAVPH